MASFSIALSPTLAAEIPGFEVVRPPIRQRYELSIVHVDDWTYHYGNAFRRINPVVVNSIEEARAILRSYERLHDSTRRNVPAGDPHS